jgi:ribonuclease III
MHNIKDILDHISEIESKLGYTFNDRSILTLAFVHRSYANENKDVVDHNERLEFLGDSILGLIIADHLFRALPKTPEGDLSYLRSRLVEAQSCVSYVSKLNVESYLLLGKGERLNDGRGRESILADLCEALIGAIYLDGGFEEAKRFIFSHFSHEIEAIIETPLHNWKALLQDYCQKKYQKAPTYHVISETGPDHSKCFVISVQINEIELGQGSGPSKKVAQQAAAADAFSKLNVRKDQ